MLISVITLFPEMISSVFAHSIAKRTLEGKKAEIRYINLRDFGLGAHRTVDDKPYGGGVGMVLRVDVLDQAIQKSRMPGKKELVVLLDPTGKKFIQETAESFLEIEHLILVCGHYEGFDARINEFVDIKLSIGDYVLSGGEIAAIVVIDSILRLLPGALKDSQATEFESFSKASGKRILEYPQYTRPEDYKGLAVPKVLLNGNHKEIEEFRKTEALKNTKKLRPDLLK